MPLPSVKKGDNAKNHAARNDRRSASRHSTPLTDTSPPTPLTTSPSPTSAPESTIDKLTPYLHTPTADLISSDPSIESLIETYSSSGTKHGDPPSARDLQHIHNQIRDVILKSMSRRSDICNHSMRQLVQLRKENLAAEQEEAAARAEQERMRAKRNADEEKRKEKERKALNKKRSHEEMENGGDSKADLPDVGAHGLARQDGVGVHDGAQAPPSPPVPQGAIVNDPMDVAPSPADSASSNDEPSSTAPLYERIYGPDPTLTEDPIIYDIRDITDDLTMDEKQQILNVAQWPESDLHDLTAGDPPDMDFSNAKPANQINFSTFQTYVEPYIRAFTEEDVAFLKERGDRFTPYLIPQRGTKGYKEVWAAEDGTTGIEPPQKHMNNPNEARGSMEDLEDDIADQDTVSLGPSMSRMLALFRQQPTAPKKDAEEDVNGDVSMANVDDLLAGETNGTTTNLIDETLINPTLKPMTSLPADAPRPTNLPQLDYETFEQRALAELRHIGLLGPTDAPDYTSHLDDEVSMRLRTLQSELRRLARLNNTRKARVLELTEERMAMQEYANIADDLDNQVNAAYLKRNRSLAKPGNKKGSAAAHAAQMARKGVAMGVGAGGRGVSDGVRALMQKRRDWIDMVGPVVGYGRAPIPDDGQTIFDDTSMRRLEKVERDAELGDAEGE